MLPIAGISRMKFVTENDKLDEFHYIVTVPCEYALIELSELFSFALHWKLFDRLLASYPWSPPKMVYSTYLMR